MQIAARELYSVIRDVYHQLQNNLETELEQFNISTVQFGVMQILSETEKASMSDLKQKIGCAPSNVTTMIQRMKRDGFVVTTKNPSDQRETLVYLTEKGQETQEKVAIQYQTFLQENFSYFDEESFNSLLEMLNGYKHFLSGHKRG
ncbi:MarR family winged helix-turn-helix transcriptional regulator [Lysinibacillus sp. BPa_S21]|uniref:MarR family winged helix-turn-helix transcriptional regulator n=1 Tax=Lysinibacillus sp. BPa_S21 TaxID=2932478 RepID=UPI0020139F0E|nr:MarR family transcriptional regulator [Lysinibacillus sp. BPa_S21]MCL1697353.1 MarR family transcriptional regulator [Lysinibacillus sp. BPa_S21]